MTTTPILKQTDDRILVYPNRTWEQFKHIQQGLEDSPGVRLAFYDGVVEIFMPGRPHEIFRTLIGSLLELFFFNNGINVVPTGAATQEREGEASAQPDESYCFGSAKPIPDLSIEVIFSSGSATKLQRYRVLGVPEVWFWEDGYLTIYRLEDDGYVKVEHSQIPELATLDLALFNRCMLMGETDWLGAVTAFRNELRD
jgi:Uma2 family endonuclease